MQLGPTGTEPILVSFFPPNITEGIDHYLAKLKATKTSNPNCTISATDESYECDLVGLEPARKYTITTQACLKGNLGCGEAIESTCVTQPMGKFTLLTYNSLHLE